MAASDIKYTPKRVKDPIAKSKHKLKRIPEHKEPMKPTPAKMKAYAKGMRQHIMNSGSKKKSYSTGGTSGGGSVGSM
jgi:hypothetical protein